MASHPNETKIASGNDVYAISDIHNENKTSKMEFNTSGNDYVSSDKAQLSTASLDHTQSLKPTYASVLMKSESDLQLDHKVQDLQIAAAGNTIDNFNTSANLLLIHLQQSYHNTNEAFANLDTVLSTMMTKYNSEVQDFTTEKLLAGKETWLSYAREVIQEWEKDRSRIVESSNGSLSGLDGMISQLKDGIDEAERPSAYPSKLAILLRGLVEFADGYMSLGDVNHVMEVKEESISPVAAMFGYGDLEFGGTDLSRFLDHELGDMDVHEDEEEDESDESMEYIPPSVVAENLEVHDIVVGEGELSMSQMPSGPVSHVKEAAATKTDSSTISNPATEVSKIPEEIDLLQAELVAQNHNIEDGLIESIELLSPVRHHCLAHINDQSNIFSLMGAHASDNSSSSSPDGGVANPVRDTSEERGRTRHRSYNEQVAPRQPLAEAINKSEGRITILETAIGIDRSELHDLGLRVLQDAVAIKEVKDLVKSIKGVSEEIMTMVTAISTTASANQHILQQLLEASTKKSALSIKSPTSLEDELNALKQQNIKLATELEKCNKRNEDLVDFVLVTVGGAHDDFQNGFVEDHDGIEDLEFLWPQGYPHRQHYSAGIGYEGEVLHHDISVPGIVDFGRGKASPGFCVLM